MENKRKFVRKELQAEIKEIIDPMQELSENDKIKLLLNDSLIDLSKKEYIEPPAYLSIKDENNKYTPVFTPSNISAITGKAKAKKSFVQSMIVATTVKNGEIDNTIISNLPENKKRIILFDTEQSTFHVSRVANRINKLIGYNANNLNVYSLRGLDAKTIIEMLNYVAYNFDNIGVIFIDQVADLAKSINSEEEAVSIVKTLEKITKEKEIHISCVIHQNKGDNFASGWLGTQIMKKAETVISVTKDMADKNMSLVSSDLSRSLEFEPFSIKIIDGLPTVYNPQTSYNEPQESQKDILDTYQEVPF